jgi:hypothetical protein
MPSFYQSGEQIQKGDHVLLHGEPGVIEFVADAADDPDNWYVTECGGGVMISEPKWFGSLFVSDTATCEDLEFVSRAQSGGT